MSVVMSEQIQFLISVVHLEAVSVFQNALTTVRDACGESKKSATLILEKLKACRHR